MLKTILALSCLTLSIGTNAAILDLGNITRDTDTGLDWLDLTESLGLSYNEVSAQLGAGGDYEGYRYATVAELDQLITNFGYVAINTDCRGTSLHCDTGMDSDSLIIEHMIRTLGDTKNQAFINNSSPFRATPDGGIGARGFIAPPSDPMDGQLAFYADIDDGEGLFLNPEGDVFVDFSDSVVSFAGSFDRIDLEIDQFGNFGNFLVAPSAVPIPAAAWLLGSALLGLGAAKRRKA